MSQDAGSSKPWLNRALELQGGGRPAEAAEAYRMHLEAHPDEAVAWAQLGTVLELAGRPEEARAACERALTLDPRQPSAHATLGFLLSRQARFAEAEGCFLQALVLDPKDLFTRMALAECLWSLGRPDEALAQLERVLALDPTHVRAFRRMALFHHLRGHRERLLQTLDRWIAADPGCADQVWERAALHLLEGRFREGWEDFEARSEVRDQPQPPIGPYAQPRWDGAPFPGRTLLLHWEQGFGDTLMFIRFAKLAKARGGRVIALVQPPLVDLVATCEGVDVALPHGAPLPDFDLYLPLLSLPRLFQIDASNLPAEVPYLQVPERVPNREHLERIFAVPTQRVKVGYLWAGNAGNLNDATRSIPPDRLAPLQEIPGVAWHCFQLPAPEAHPFPSVPLGPLLSNFSDTALALSHMDLVLTVDTALAHLAGALGLPTFLMLRYGSEWRWQLHRTDSPWYPTMRIYRQTEPGDWDGVIRRIIDDLTAPAPEAAAEPLQQSPEALIAEGHDRVQAGRFEEAEPLLRQALVERSGDHEARLDLVECLLRRGDLHQGLQHLDRILRAEPAHGRALQRMLDVYTAARDRQGVIRTLDRWLAVAPDRHDLRWERGTMHLMEGHYLQGWEDIEARFLVKDQIVSMMGPFTQPLWDGSPFPGKTLLLHWEQGMGDTLMFIRYAKRAKALGGRVVAVVQPALVGVVGACEGIDEAIADEAPLPPFDLHLPIMSLPRIFRTDEASIPADIPYLRVPDQVPNREALQALLAPSEGRVRIGYAWAGSPRHLNDAIRSMPPEQLAPLAALPEVAWHSFQMPPPERHPLPSVALGPKLSSFSDTAFALSHMDLVITVDTALAHASGAMGIPTFLMLAFGSEWRWQWDRPDSPWYPTMRIYRQPEPGAWEAVIQAMLRDLASEA